MDAQADTTAPVIAAFAPSKSQRGPVEFALAASRVIGAPLIVVHVHRGGPLVKWYGGDADDSMGDDARALSNLQKDFERTHTKASIEVVNERTIGGGLLKAIEQFKPQLVVLGSSTRGKLGHVLISGTAERVIHDATCPVAVVPHGYERPENGVQMIGAAFSVTDEGREALETAITMARNAGVKLRAITVLEGNVEAQTSGMMAEQHREGGGSWATEEARRRMGAEAAMKSAVAELAPDLDVDIDVLAQEPAEALIAASRHVDMLVMGSRARGGKRAVVLGSVSRAVVGGAACPVLVLPRGASEISRRLAGSVQAPGTA